MKLKPQADVLVNRPPEICQQNNKKNYCIVGKLTYSTY